MSQIKNKIKDIDHETGMYRCDLAMSMPAAPGRLAKTKPYFSSIEAMVYRTGEGYELNKVSDIAKVSKENKKLKIGIFDRGVATEPLLINGLGEQIKYYAFMPGDARVYAGRIIEDALASGEIDVAFVWGPIAGYFASKSDVPMAVVPLNELGERYIFSFALGMRHGDKAWKALLNEILEANQDKVASILAEYNFPDISNVAVYEVEPEAVPYQVVDGKVDDKTFKGWRLFHSTCFKCHGKGAVGTDRAPSLLPRLEGMNQNEFERKVLQRHYVTVSSGDPDQRAAIMAAIAEGNAYELDMPAWIGDPNVEAHVAELYSYLKARSDGVLGDERPEKLE